MSIDLDIAPSKATPIRWVDVEPYLRSSLGHLATSVLGPSPSFLHFVTHAPVDPYARLTIDAAYIPGFSPPTTLLLSVVPNTGYVDPYTYLEDYGRNLTAERVSQIADIWHKAGYYYELTTNMGRAPGESRLFVALAWAVARASAGFVIVMNHDILNLDVGVYSSEEFEHAQPMF